MGHSFSNLLLKPPTKLSKGKMKLTILISLLVIVCVLCTLEAHPCIFACRRRERPLLDLLGKGIEALSEFDSVSAAGALSGSGSVGPVSLSVSGALSGAASG